MVETIEEYLARGGEIEECPPQKAKDAIPNHLGGIGGTNVVNSYRDQNKRNRRIRNRLRRKYKEYVRKNNDK